MSFAKAISVIKYVLEKAGTTINMDDYDGVIVKKLAASNTLDEGRTTNQTHIAITGAQMDIFPYLCADGYFYDGAVLSDVDLKKYFVIQVPVTLHESNLKHLGYSGIDLSFSNGILQTATSVVRSKRKAQSDQLQVSLLDMDGRDFVAFRRLMKAGTYFILLKKKASMSYDAFGINASILSGIESQLSPLNNLFYKGSTHTPVDATVFNSVPDVNIQTDAIPTNLSIDDLGKLLQQMYNNAKATGQVASIHMFGFKYGKCIVDNGYSVNKIVSASGIKPSFVAEVNKGVNIYKSTLANEYGVHFYEEEENNSAMPITNEPVFFPRTNKIHPLNCILYGAPGTGKTYITAEYALAILENRAVDESPKAPEQRKAIMEQYRTHVGNERIVFTTFHQSYGYEDFIQGLRPVSTNGGTDFVPVDGVFKRIADTAMKHPEDNYVIIIDEINRANISKVFGELITLIEDDKRWGEVNALQVTLPSGDSFKIPNNLYIVGTMNSADKSISLIDTALRRRFEFIEVTPNASLIADPVLRSTLEKLNTSLAKELDSTDLLVGHAYFIGKTEDDLCSIFNRSIIPLLYEYFYDNSTKVKAQIKNALPNDQYEITGGTVGRIKISKK